MKQLKNMDLDMLALIVRSIVQDAGIEYKHCRSDVVNGMELQVIMSSGRHSMATWNISVRPASDFTDPQGKIFHFPAEFQFHGTVTPLALKVLETINKHMPTDRRVEDVPREQPVAS